MALPNAPSVSKATLWRRLLPVLVLVSGFVAFFALGLERYLSLDVLRQHRETLLRWVEFYGILAALTYIGIYTIAVAFSLPGASLLSITSGFLFGTVWGAAVVVLSATMGATLLFLITKTAFGDTLRARAGGWLRALEAGFQDNALSYLIVLRLVPIFPFFIVNLVPALLGVRLSTFVVGTFVGIIPGAVVFTSIGAGLGSIFDAGGTLSLTGVLTPQVITALVGLAVLALIPVVYKKLLARRAASPSAPQASQTLVGQEKSDGHGLR